MENFVALRRELARRLIHVMGLGVAAGPVMLVASGAGCGGNVVLDGGAQGSGGGAGAGGAGPTSSVGTMNTSVGSGGMCTLSAAASSGFPGGPVHNTRCLTVPEPCPAPAAFAQILQHSFDLMTMGCEQLDSIDCGPVLVKGACCYVDTEHDKCVKGRPFMVAGVAQSSVRTAGVWGVRAGGARPQIAGIPAALRQVLARCWTTTALDEHASIASFGRFALDLLALGAPPDLIADAHQGALDEIRHARLCFELAAAYGGEDVAPSPFPFEGDRVAVATDLAAFAAATAREGCIGETIAAVEIAVELATATDVAVRSVLTVIAEDEARHAELSWRALAWALAAGGEPARRAVREVFAEAERTGAAPPPRRSTGTLEERAILAAHGILDAGTRLRERTRTFAEVVRPCAEALLS